MVESDGTDALVRSAGQRAKQRRRIVVFADGTGNAFTRQESNVWRMYRAFRQGIGEDGVEQVARYIPGVGTSGNALIRGLDAMTGFGVPANVRKAYRFLCWNHADEDEIHLIGFSRGAFTVRTLAGMVSRQGLMPARWESGDLPPDYRNRAVTESEMKRNVQAAWLAYRGLTAPFRENGRIAMAPWIHWVRQGRDWLDRARRNRSGYPQHGVILASLPLHRRPPPQEGALPEGGLRIASVGVFDTVEAYGLPVDELRRAFSWLLWPISFRNTYCARVVEEADHLLSLDDERLTFRPLRFDQRDAGTGDHPPKIRELWFAGVHSDIGGGYPESSAAMEALDWMVRAAEARGLQFNRDLLAGPLSQRSAQSEIHDSRAGLAMAYRYEPREKQDGAEFGGPLVLHGSVVRKMDHGYAGYAPLFLPKTFRVNEGPEDWKANDSQSLAGMGEMPLRHNEGPEAEVRRLVFSRRANNRLQIALAVFFVTLPLFSAVLCGQPLMATLCQGLKAWWSAVFLDLKPLWALYHPLWLAVLAILLAALWLIRQGRALGGRIKDNALKVWTAPGAAGVQPGSGGG